MKLYTEEQVRFIIGRAQISGLNEDYLIEQAESIELPSDDEIDKEAREYYFNSWTISAFKNGAEWMRDKIQGDKK